MVLETGMGDLAALDEKRVRMEMEMVIVMEMGLEAEDLAAVERGWAYKIQEMGTEMVMEKKMERGGDGGTEEVDGDGDGKEMETSLLPDAVQHVALLLAALSGTRGHSRATCV